MSFHPTYLFTFGDDLTRMHSIGFLHAEDLIAWFDREPELQQVEQFVNVCESKRLKGGGEGFFWFLRSRSNGLLIYLGDPGHRVHLKSSHQT